jgi:hypothetical protein
MAALAGILGCSSGDDGKAATDGKGGQQQAQAAPQTAPEDKQEEPSLHVIPGEHGAPVKGEQGHLMQTLVTPQGGTVKVRADHDPWADNVISFTPGKPMSRASPDPSKTLGKPDFVAGKRQTNTFLSMGHGGELVLEFADNRLVDGAGDDLVVFEIGTAIEPVDIAISTDGKVWIEVGHLKGAKCTADIGPAVRKAQADRVLVETRPEFRFVKVRDAKAGKSNNSSQQGADIDAVGALNSIPVPR